MYVNIPLSSSLSYEMAVALEGSSYTLSMEYNSRQKLYYMSLYDSEKNPVIVGVPIVPTYPIANNYVIPSLNGFFLLINKSSDIYFEAYKLYPEKISEYYDLVYVYTVEG